MPRGRIPKPPEAKARPSRRTSEIVQIPPFNGSPEPPAELGTAGREAWNRYWNSASWLVESDWTGVLLLCQTLDAIEEVAATIRAEGREVKGSRGQPVANPLLAVAASLRTETFRWMQEYGFTPAARRRLGLPLESTKPRVSKLDRFVAAPYEHLRDDPRAHLGQEA